MPNELTKLGLTIPLLPSCTVPTGRGVILLEKLPLPTCPGVPALATPDLCGKIAEMEAKIEETVEDLELVVAYTHAVELPRVESCIDEDHPCATSLTVTTLIS